MSNFDDRGTGDAPRPSRPDYVPKVALVPQTLDDLMQRVGPYADAAKAHLEWSAVTVWLMKEGDKVVVAAALPSAVAILSVFLARAAEEREAGWPILSGIIATPALYGSLRIANAKPAVLLLRPALFGRPMAVRTFGLPTASGSFNT